MNALPMTQVVKNLTNSRKKTFYLTTSTTFACTSGWSGGSISYFNLWDFILGKELPLQGVGNQFNKLAVSQELPMNAILIETGVFCGKPSCPQLTCRPEQEQQVKAFLGVLV